MSEAFANMLFFPCRGCNGGWHQDDPCILLATAAISPFFVECNLAAQYAMDRWKDAVEMVGRMTERITLFVAAAAAASHCPLGSC